MKLETLTVELRPRSSWEAMELGAALVRRHAAAIWTPWLLVTGVAFVLLNLAAWAVGQIWLAWLLMWWLRPVFDRIPQYVLSRAVFGSVPGTAETLRAQLRWGWKPMLGHLTWRRFSPLRAAMLPIDLLEGADPARLAERRRVIGGGVSGPAVLLTLICQHFLLALAVSVVLLVMLFVPNELLPEAARATWAMLTEDTPAWALIALNAVDWLAVAFIEPFYVGAGFGLYLNRRTQLEAWDLEIAFRRMRKRLEAVGASMLLVLALCLPMAMPAHAWDDNTCPFPEESAPDRSAPEKQGPDSSVGQDAAPDKRVPEKNGAQSAAPGKTVAGKPGTAQRANKQEAEQAADKPFAVADGESRAGDVDTRTLREIFGDDTAGHAAFEKSVAEAYKDPLLRPKLEQTTWQPRDRDKKKDKPFEAEPPRLAWLAALVGFLAEYGLWLLVAALVVALLVTARRWWPWLIGGLAVPEPEPDPVEMTHLAHTEPLPPDIATVARRLWAQGQPRRALALLYRASVEAMTARVDAHPPPGATEADCLRLSRRMPEAEDRDAFQRMVRIWQYAAYGQRLPAADDFETLVQTLAERFRWAA